MSQKCCWNLLELQHVRRDCRKSLVFAEISFSLSRNPAEFTIEDEKFPTVIYNLERMKGSRTLIRMRFYP